MSHYTLLAVDDEPDIRQLLRIFFERYGFTVLLANDGQTGLELARQHVPNVILMDIQMPVMSGIEVVRVLRTDARFTRTPIIAVTAYAKVHVAADIVRAGFNDVIYKPLDFGTLYETVEMALAKQ